MDTQYTVAVETVKGGELARGSLYRAATHPNGLVSFVEGGAQTAYDIFQHGLHQSRNQPCLGKRQSGKPDGYVWWTYGEVENMSKMIGSAILHRGLIKTQKFPEEKYVPAQKLDILGIVSKNRVEWFVTEQAANYYNFTLVPLYNTLGEEAINHILAKTKMTCLAASETDLVVIMELLRGAGSKRNDCISSAIVFDSPTSSTERLAKELGIELHFWVDLMDHAKTSGIFKPRLPNPENVQTICFTSGTTGIPKGVIITHKMFASMINAAHVGPLMPGASIHLGPNDLHISYLPLAHVFERAIACLMWYAGAKIAIYGGEPKDLMDDIKAARPTIFVSVPRLYMRIFDKIMASVQSSSRVAQYAFRKALDSKLADLKATGDHSHFVWDHTVFSKARALMGGRLRYMLSGGAALEQEIQEKLGVIFGVDFLEGYGATEAMGASFIRRANETVYGHIGGPLPSLEMVLEQVPDMPQYDPLSASEPGGHLLIRGPQVMPGYFMDSQATADAFTEDGFYRSGDVAIRLGDGGRLKIVDRAKNLFKLSQGEYIAPERLELIFGQAPLVSQIFVHGDDKHNSLVAIICVDDEVLNLWLKQGNRSDLQRMSTEKLKASQNSALKEEIKRQLDEQAHTAKLAGFERIKDFFLWESQFSPDNNLLTPTLKMKRGLVMKQFTRQIEELLASA
eukprot:Gregarina_sp_Poly_1__5759@NODE_302_length_9747_cov_161_916736_g261_i0_p2_GENE_NODE_302_length_9747_cov_161_916736_g261_i0NODE_302_length_9747_cov_161_916736_g261_i0_p2_ORF_typecomplete_len681_score88_59AMPbinding/PF00501_28/3_7e81GH3/PF03321_13/0_13_NODE_302_length_9747_cov_161_916736_g261_i045776619